MGRGHPDGDQGGSEASGTLRRLVIAPVDDQRTERRARIPHVAALDGLRGVAVAGVMLFHAGHLQGGFLGVDLFFTLSGYLITSLLLVERSTTGTVSLRRFWGRRFRRLLPALLVVVAASAMIAPTVVRAGELDRFRTQALATLGYVANWAEVARASDYFALFDAPSPLDHAWSLAIEEQFYLAWPLLVLAVGRLGRPRAAVRTLAGAGVAVSLVVSWSVVAGADGVTRAYYGADTRAASILVGAVLATWTAGVARGPSTAERATARLAPLALLGVLASWTFADGADPGLYRFGLVAHALATVVVIAAVSGPEPGVVRRVLEHPVLVRAGVLSYGLYLWHWPVFLLLDAERTGLDGLVLTAVRVGVSVVLAELSYRLVEAPIRYERVRLGRPVLGAAAAFAVTAVVVVVAARPDAQPLPPVALDAATRPAPSGSPPGTPDVGSVLLAGDSQAFTLAMHAPARELGVRVGSAANLGCGLSVRGIVLHGERVERRERCTPIVEQMHEDVARADADVVAVLSGVWESSDQLVDGRVVPFGDPTWTSLVRQDFIAAVGPMAATQDVVLLTAPCFAEGAQREEYALEDIDERIAAVNAVFVDAAAELGVPVVDLGGHLCPGGQPVTEIDGYVVRPDGVHFDEAGARLVWPWLLAQLTAVRAG
jgi:peptidoglycan/LPS O-acetylase OafA/YrhL